MDSPASHRISVPRGTQVPGASRFVVAYGAVTLSRGSFQNPSANDAFAHSLALRRPGPTTPHHLAVTGFRLLPFRSPLLGECFLFLGVLRCFSSPGALPRIYVFNPRVPGDQSRGVTPFGNPRIKRLLTAPRGLSQPTTSFFGFWRQGIRRVLFLA